jgi:hypothetical protein
VLIDDDVLRIRDKYRHLLAKINRSTNRLYKIDLRITRLVCLAVHGDDEAWLWHARFGHLSFDALRNLARHGMVRGLPEIDHDGELWDSCLAGKQRRRPFPKTTTYHTEELMELVHGDLCGPITSATHGGWRFFLLLVDDCSRYTRGPCYLAHARSWRSISNKLLVLFISNYLWWPAAFSFDPCACQERNQPLGLHTRPWPLHLFFFKN